MKIRILLDSKESLEKLIKQDLPIKTAYKLGKFIKSANTELKDFDEFRTNLLDKYGQKQENGSYTLTSENATLFQSDMEEILDSEIPIEIPVFTLNELGDAKLSSNDLIALSYLIVEE